MSELFKTCVRQARPTATVSLSNTAVEGTARRTRILQVILYSAIALTVLMLVAVLIFVPDPSNSLIIILAFFLWELAVLWTMRHGQVQTASLLLTLGLCLNALVTSLLFGGVRQLTFSTYVLVVLTGGLLLGKRAALFLAAFGIVAGLGILLAELAGFVSHGRLVEPTTAWAADSATFAWAAIVLYMALQSIERELQRRSDEVRKRREAQAQITLLHVETAKHLRHVESLHIIDQAITTTQDLQAILQVLLEQVQTQLQIDSAAVCLLEPDQESLRVTARRGFPSSQMRAQDQTFREPLAVNAATARHILQVPDLLATDCETCRAAARNSEDLASYYAAPIIAQDTIIGVLEVFTHARLEVDARWLDFFQTLATQGAIAVDNTTLFQTLQRKNVELSLAYDATIEGWSRALELRDGETEGHSHRVTDMTMLLAHHLDMPAAQFPDIRRGALLHDIGKMAIPDAILLKPGPLDAREWEIMQRHPVYAKELLSSIPFLRNAIDIPYCHHEKWDGSGYPRGLKGQDIPHAARMFALVDVWDALSSDRPYRSAWKREEIRGYLLTESGRHFDPDLVQVFVGILDQLQSSARMTPAVPFGSTKERFQIYEFATK